MNAINLPILTPESLLRQLELDSAYLAERHRLFGEAMARLPVKIENEEQAQMAADFASQLKAGADLAESKRIEAKQPFDQLAKVAHNHYGRYGTDFTEWRRSVLNRVGGYQAQKREAERQRLEAEAAARRAEAEKLAEAGDIDAATQVAESAVKAEAQAAAPAVGRTQGALGGQLGSRTVWEPTVTDITKLPPEYLLPNMPAIRAFMSGQVKQKKTPILAGVEFKQVTSTTGR